MDAKTIETLAVNAVRDTIVICDYLDQYISDNDKEPSWDGHIYVFKAPSKKKDVLMGRIPVQVKGSTQLDPTADRIKYSVEISDLKNYLGDGGVIYFVVAMSQDGSQRTVFYVSLAPVNLKLILEKHSEQKTVSLEFCRFPTDNAEKASLCMNFRDDLTKQASFKGAALLTPEELKDNGDVEGLEMTRIHIGPKESLGDALLRQPPYLYVRMKGCPIPQPLLFLPENAFLQGTVLSLITVNGTLFYDRCEHFKSLQNKGMRIGKSVSLTYLPGSDAGTLSINLTPMLNDRIRDLRFIIAMMKNKGFEYNKKFLPYEAKGELSQNVEEAEEILSFYEKVNCLLKMLRVTQDLDVSKLSEEDIETLQLLIHAIVYKKSIAIKMPSSPKLHVKVGYLKFLFWVQKDPENSDRVYLYDYFTLDVSSEWTDKNARTIQLSHYAFLSLEEITSSANLCLDNVIPAFEKYTDNSEAYLYYNNILLLLLMAIDCGGERVQIYQTYAIQLAEWLLNTPENVILKRMSYVNKLQTIKRTRRLDENETKQLWEMIDTYPNDACFQVCAYLLLDLEPMAERILALFSEDDQKSIRESPIYHFAGKE